jgi:hypothetical protein
MSTQLTVQNDKVISQPCIIGTHQLRKSVVPSAQPFSPGISLLGGGGGGLVQIGKHEEEIACSIVMEIWLLHILVCR